jgi:hypothetical protein
VHALIAINSSPYAWIIDSGASHHMEATKHVLSSLKTCTGPPILMGDDSPVEVSGQGRVDLGNGSFENVLHVLKLSINILSMYQITHIGTRKRVEFTLDFVTIFDMEDNSKIVVGEVDHK